MSAGVLVLATAMLATAVGPSLTPATLAAWDTYVRQVQQQVDAHACSESTTPSALDALRRGEISIQDVDSSRPDVPDGAIHHWRGLVLLRGARLAAVLSAVRDPANHKQEDVLEGRLLSRRDNVDRVFLKLKRTALVTAGYNTEHEVTYRFPRADCALSTSNSIRIIELEHVGTPREREKAPGEDRGFLWRMHAAWRYQQVPEGVLVSLESLSLSRAVPWALRPVASPIVGRIARESVSRTLEGLRARF